MASGCLLAWLSQIGLLIKKRVEFRVQFTLLTFSRKPGSKQNRHKQVSWEVTLKSTGGLPVALLRPKGTNESGLGI